MSNTSYTPPPQARSRGFTLYLAVWIVLGGISAGYLAVLAMKQGFAAPYLAAFQSAPGPVAEAPPAPEASEFHETPKVAEEVRSLRESVDQVQATVEKLAVKAEEQNARNKEFDARITALEVRPSAENVPPAADVQPGVAGPVAEAGNGAFSGDLPVNLGNGEAGKADSPSPELETGSVRKAAGQPPAAAKAAQQAAKPTGVQIGEAPSLDALRVSWLALSDRHAAALRNLEARYVVARSGGKQTYELIAGPLKSPAEARKICESLSGDGLPCKVGQFGGNAL